MNDDGTVRQGRTRVVRQLEFVAKFIGKVVAFDFQRPCRRMRGIMEERRTTRGGPIYWLKRRSRRFWIIAIALLPMYYVASFGPVCWMSSHAAEEIPLLETVYYPLLRMMASGKTQSIRDREVNDRQRSGVEWVVLKRGALSWYSRVGADQRCCWQYIVHYDQPPGKPAIIDEEQWLWTPK